MLLKQFNELLLGKDVPSKLKDVTISILFKKGDEQDCDNYRGLSLINHEGKLLEKMIHPPLAIRLYPGEERCRLCLDI